MPPSSDGYGPARTTDVAALALDYGDRLIVGTIRDMHQAVAKRAFGATRVVGGQSRSRCTTPPSRPSTARSPACCASRAEASGRWPRAASAVRSRARVAAAGSSPPSTDSSATSCACSTTRRRSSCPSARTAPTSRSPAGRSGRFPRWHQSHRRLPARVVRGRRVLVAGRTHPRRHLCVARAGRYRRHAGHDPLQHRPARLRERQAPRRPPAAAGRGVAGPRHPHHPRRALDGRSRRPRGHQSRHGVRPDLAPPRP